jgi:hypothetical protein
MVPAADGDPKDGDGTLFSIRSTAAVAGLSLIAMLPVFQLDLSLRQLFAMNPVPFIRSLLPVLLTLPLPAAYIALISKRRFRKEALGTAVVLPFALLGQLFTVFAAGMVLGSLFVSYKGKSVYNGRNVNWMHFRAAGGMIVLTAVVAGLVAASFYSNTAPFREDIRGNITQESVDMAMDYAETAGVGGDEVQPESTDAQAQQLTSLMGPLAANLSVASIRSTETIVFRAVQETRNRDSSKFDASERTVLRTAFDTAENQVPSTVQQQAEQTMQRQLQEMDGAADVKQDTLRSMVTPRVRKVVNRIITDSEAMTAVAFVSASSIVMLFKLPYAFVGALYAAIIGRVLRSL